MKKLFSIFAAILVASVASAVNLPGALAPSDAQLSELAFVDGNSYLHFTPTNQTGYILDQYGKWAVHSAGGNYSFTLNANSSNSHHYLLTVLSADEQAEITSFVLDGHSGQALEETTDEVTLPVGDYVIKIQNTTQYSEGYVTSLVANYKGGAAVQLPAQLLPADALFSELASADGNGYMHFTGSNNTGYILDQYIKWNVASIGGYYSFTLNANSSNSHHYLLKVLSADEQTEITSFVLDGSSGQALEETTAKVNLPVGNYVVRIQNTTNYSEGYVTSLVANYNGGASIEVPETLLPDDAILSPRAWVDRTGAVDSILFTPRNAEGYNLEEWVKWSVKVTKAGFYNFTANTYRASSQKFEITLLNEAENEVLISNDNGGQSIGSGNQSISTGKIELAAGKYFIRVRNIYNYAPSRLLNVVVTYEGGAIVEVPETLVPDDAILSPRAWVDRTGAVDSILFTPRNAEGYNLEEWVKWRVRVTKAGFYNFTANTYRASSQKFEITLLNEAENDVLISNDNGGQSIGSGNQSISTGNIILPEAVYVIRVRNIYNYAPSRLLSVVVTYEGGALVEAPGELLAEDAVIDVVENGSKKMVHENGNLKYKNNGSNMDEFAYWNIHVAEPAEMIVALDVATAGHLFTLELYKGADLVGSIDETDDTEWDEGEIVLADHFNITESGNYILKLINRQQWSGGALHAITLTAVPAPPAPVYVTIDENDEDNSAWVDNVGEAAVNVQLARSFLGGMFNTICLPFALDEDQIEAAFGEGFQLMELEDAIVENDILTLNFTPVLSIWPGTPYIIRPLNNVANPTFDNVSLLVEEADMTPKAGANFIGTLVKDLLPAGENTLYLGQNNTLYFPAAEKEIKGMRAYFHVNVPNAAQVIRRARIVEGGHVATELPVVNPALDAKAHKMLENGQIIIIRDSKRHSILGQQL